MFPPLASRESIIPDGTNQFTWAYHDVVIYDAPAADEPLYEGPIVVHANGWIELEGNRLLSPQAIHHIDIYDDEPTPSGGDTDRDSVDDRDRGDDYRTNRFSTK